MRPNLFFHGHRARAAPQILSAQLPVVLQLLEDDSKIGLGRRAGLVRGREGIPGRRRRRRSRVTWQSTTSSRWAGARARSSASR